MRLWVLDFTAQHHLLIQDGYRDYSCRDSPIPRLAYITCDDTFRMRIRGMNGQSKTLEPTFGSGLINAAQLQCGVALHPSSR